jgi:GMP synthase (glutamine-hydrolysing)
MLVLGGSMGAYDDATCPWLGEVKQLVRSAAVDAVPTLGICLGHQLAAVALGGKVARNPGGQQVGIFEVGWLPEARRDLLLGPIVGPAPAVQWNNDVVAELPAGAVLLARTPTGEVQAARFAPTVWGVQWHPEVDDHILRLWADEDRDEAVERGVDLDAHVAAVASAREVLRRTWQPLADGFAALLTEVGSETRPMRRGRRTDIGRGTVRP